MLKMFDYIGIGWLLHTLKTKIRRRMREAVYFKFSVSLKDSNVSAETKFYQELNLGKIRSFLPPFPTSFLPSFFLPTNCYIQFYLFQRFSVPLSQVTLRLPSCLLACPAKPQGGGTSVIIYISSPHIHFSVYTLSMSIPDILLKLFSPSSARLLQLEIQWHSLSLICVTSLENRPWCFTLGLSLFLEILVFLMYLWLFLLDHFQECWDPKCWYFSECSWVLCSSYSICFPG